MHSGREAWEADPGGLHACATLIHKSPEPFDAGSSIELVYALTPCHGIREGSLRLIVPASDSSRYLLGDEVTLRLRQF